MQWEKLLWALSVVGGVFGGFGVAYWNDYLAVKNRAEQLKLTTAQNYMLPVAAPTRRTIIPAFSPRKTLQVFQ